MHPNHVVTHCDLIATSRYDFSPQPGDFWSGRVLCRFGGRQLLVETAPRGASPERAIAFAMRAMADAILAEFPREFPDPP